MWQLHGSEKVGQSPFIKLNPDKIAWRASCFFNGIIFVMCQKRDKTFSRGNYIIAYAAFSSAAGYKGIAQE